MDEQLRRAQQRYKELQRLLQDSTVMADREHFVQLSREFGELDALLRLHNDLELIERARTATTRELTTTDDDDLRALAERELSSLDQQAATLRERINEALNPPDPNDRKDIVVEIRSGVGGDEAALFAAELFRMYLRYAERHGWKSQLVSESRTPLGGFKEVIVELNGGPIYRSLKFESGVHRVQRVPVTEKSGRVHTSTATVVVLPEADEVEMTIDPKDLEIMASTARGHGGQSVNTTYSAIRVLHKPTGIIVNCQDERSQTQNREKALRILRTRLLAHEQEKRRSEASATRKSLIGSGERSEKIRTYNFPQDRLTDHRLKESVHGLSKILDGDLDAIVKRLQAEEKKLASEHSAT